MWAAPAGRVEIGLELGLGLENGQRMEGWLWVCGGGGGRYTSLPTEAKPSHSTPQATFPKVRAGQGRRAGKGPAQGKDREGQGRGKGKGARGVGGQGGRAGRGAGGRGARGQGGRGGTPNRGMPGVHPTSHQSRTVL